MLRGAVAAGGGVSHPTKIARAPLRACAPTPAVLPRGAAPVKHACRSLCLHPAPKPASASCTRAAGGVGGAE